MQTTLTQTASSHPLSDFAKTIPGGIVLGLAATLVVAAAAHVAVPLWFTPVPLTLQPLAVLGVGLALGPVTGFFAMLAYLAEGACGLPVFAPTGPGGIAQILGPSGGYLMAYPLVVVLVGGLTRVLAGRMPRFLAATLGGAAAVMLLFLCGATWLGHLLHLSLQQAWIEGVAPYLPGEAIKVLAAAGIYNALTSAPAAGQTK